MPIIILLAILYLLKDSFFSNSKSSEMAAAGIFSSKFKELINFFLINHESFSPKPLWDIKQWSWGYGTKVPDSLGKSVVPNKTITKEQAIKDSYEFIHREFKDVWPKIKVPLNDNQRAAIVSFGYNLGTATGNDTPLGNLIADINSGDRDRIEYGFKAYNRGGGRVLKGLTKRRKYEFDLFMS